jgi:hypothetical protein
MANFKQQVSITALSIGEQTQTVVPAVKLGILEAGLSWSQLLTMRYAI